MVQYMTSNILLLLEEEINYCWLEKYMFILLLWQCFFATRWLEEERLRLLASVVVVRSERALGCGCLVLELGTGVTKILRSSSCSSASTPSPSWLASGSLLATLVTRYCWRWSRRLRSVHTLLRFATASAVPNVPRETIQYNAIVYWHSPGGAFRWQCD